MRVKNKKQKGVWNIFSKIIKQKKKIPNTTFISKRNKRYLYGCFNNNYYLNTYIHAKYQLNYIIIHVFI